MSKLQTIADRFEETFAALRQEANDILMQEFKDIFNANPSLKTIVWTQYTPYFNDGDECVFSVGDMCASNYLNITHYGEYDYGIVDSDEAQAEPEDEPDDLLVHYYYEKNSSFTGFSELGSFMNSQLGEEVLKFAFGDHVIVRVTREGIEVEEYDHE